MKIPHGSGRIAWPTLRLTEPARAGIDGSLLVTKDLTGGGRDVSADGAKLDEHLAATGNPHGTKAADVGALASVQGVTNPGGNIELVSTDAITISADSAAKRITIGENHSSRRGNPHGAEAADVGALATSGGNISGTVSLQRIPHNRAPVVRIAGEDIGEFGLGIWAFPDDQKCVGLYISGDTSRILNMIDGETHFRGPVRFNYGKQGYVVDLFMNASGRNNPDR